MTWPHPIFAEHALGVAADPQRTFAGRTLMLLQRGTGVLHSALSQPSRLH